MADPDPKKKLQPLSDEAMTAAFQAEHQPTHDQKWAALTAADAPMVRRALVRSEEIRAEGLDPGEAYLQAIADFAYFRERASLQVGAQQLLATPTEPPEVDPGS
jgi:hypothetical protein